MENDNIRYRVTNAKGIYKKADFQLEEEKQKCKMISLESGLPTYQICETIIRAFDGKPLDTWGLSLDEVVDFCIKQKDTKLLDYLQPSAFDLSNRIHKDFVWNLYTTHVNQSIKDYKTLLHFIHKFDKLKEKALSNDDKEIIENIEKAFYTKCDKAELLSNAKFTMNKQDTNLEGAINKLINFDIKREKKYRNEEIKYLYLINDTLIREAKDAKKLDETQKENKRNELLEQYFLNLNLLKVSSADTYYYTNANITLKRFLMYSDKSKINLQEKMLRGKLLSKFKFKSALNLANQNQIKDEEEQEK